MSEHWKDYLLALLAALATHYCAEQLHHTVREMSLHGLPGLKGDSVPAQGILVIVLILLAASFRSKLYPWKPAYGPLTVWGLLAIQFVGMQVGTIVHEGHLPGTVIEWISGAVAVLSLAYLGKRFHVTSEIHAKDDEEITSKADHDVHPVEAYKRLRVRNVEGRPGLILFLSLLTGEGFRPGDPTKVLDGGELIETDGWKQYQEAILAIVAAIRASGDDGYRLQKSDLLQPLGRFNIRMPLESIRILLASGELRHVVVIPSADTPTRVIDRKTGEVVQHFREYTGSHGQFEFFAKVVRELFGPLVHVDLRIEQAPPVDFENEEQISRSIQRAREMLRKHRNDLHYLDLTGGQALCSVVGAVQSLGEEHRCLYISTRDYHPIPYNFVAQQGPEIG